MKSVETGTLAGQHNSNGNAEEIMLLQDVF